MRGFPRRRFPLSRDLTARGAGCESTASPWRICLRSWQRASSATPIRVTETGEELDRPVVATGTGENGSVAQNHCSGWTATSGNTATGYGWATGVRFSFMSSASCNALAHIYCFGVDRKIPLSYAKLLGPRAFVAEGFHSGRQGARGCGRLLPIGSDFGGADREI